ncbi:MAG TPA: hypothetical protein VHE83_00140, partial [Mycobacteriales bacterium]|nr:hypothetical protein [Mycobacteriales bacterium]
VSVVGSREWLDGQGFATPWDPGSPGWAPGPEMMVRLEDVDVMQLSAAERVGFALAWERCVRYAEARRAEAIAFAAGEKPQDRAADATVFELAGLFGQSSSVTGAQVDVARDLVDTFGATLAAVEDGVIPFGHAEAMVELTQGLSWLSCQRVEARVLPGAGERTLGAHRRLLLKVVAEFERECDDAPPPCPSGERRVSTRDIAPGLAALSLIGPTAQIAAAAAAIESLAQAPRQAGDPRSLPNKRFDAAIDLLTGTQPVSVELVVHANADGTFTVPSLPGLCDLGAPEMTKLMSGGTVRFFDPRLKPPPVDRYEWSTAQRKYLQARDRRCRFPGCGAPAERCDCDHGCSYWTAGGDTDVDNGSCLCRRHHRMKHHGWALQLLPDGSVLWTSPNGIQLRDPPLRD